MARPSRRVLSFFFLICLAAFLASPLAAVRRDFQVNSDNDDGEQTPSNGAVDLTGSPLRFGFRTIGIRFTGVRIPQGATIVSAVLEFESRANESGTTNLTVWGHDTNNATALTTSNSNFTNRTATSATVAWNNVPAWTNGQRYQTPNLASVVQEIVNRPGWASNNAMVFVISGTGQRTADQHDVDEPNATILRVEYAGQEQIPGLTRCYGVADSTNDLLILESTNGTTTTVVGDNGVTGIEGIALDPLDFALYAANPNSASTGHIGRINLATGEFIRLTEPMGNGPGALGVQTFADVDGMTFDLSTRELYASVRREGNPNLADLLIKLNPDTGAHIPNAFGAGIDYVVITGTGVQPDIDDLAIDPADGTLYAAGTANGTALIRVNRTTGAGTVVGSFGTTDMEGMGYRFDGVLYSTQASRMYTINTLTGQATQIGTGDTITGGTDVEGFDCHFTALTRAVVSRLEAYRSGGRTVVEWETASEEGTVGFHLYRRDDKGGYVPVTQAIQPALFGAPQGGIYRVEDAGAPASPTLGYYLLEVEAGGRRQWHGPFLAHVAAAPPGFAAAGLEPAAHPPTVPALGLEPEPAIGTSAEVKIALREPGLYFVGAAELAGLFGESVAQVRQRIANGFLALTHRGDQVAWLGTASGFYFYAEPLEDLFTAEHVYRLSRRPGLRMTQLPAAAGRPSPGLSFATTEHFEDDVFAGLAASPDPEDDFWFWRGISAGHPTVGTAVVSPVVAAPVASGTATLTVRLYGVSDTGLAGEHVARVSLNGTVLGDTTWSGKGHHAATFEVPQALLLGGANELRLTGILPPEVPFSFFYFDSADLAYRRTYVSASGTDLVFRGDGHRTVSVSGLDRPEVTLFDVSDPLQPRLVGRLFAPVGSDDGAGGYRLDVRPASAATRYLALTPDAVQAPSLRPWKLAEPSLVNRDRSAEYLILAPSSLASAAEELAAYREGRGLTADVVELEEIYNELNDGYASPHALRAFLAVAAERWSTRPRYVVLAGRGTYDYLDRLGLGDNLVPPILVRGIQGLFAGDGRMGDVWGDAAPELAVGRLPVRTPEELLAYLDKIVAYESATGSWTGRALLTVDQHDVGGDFTAASRQLQALLPRPLVGQEISLATLDLPAARATLLSALEAGASLWTFTGHASVSGLTNGGLLTSGDVAGLTNGERLPVLLPLTCQVNRFDLPGFPALGEHLTLAPGGGAAAVWGPSGLSPHAEAADLAAAFLRHLATSDEPVLGDVILQATAEHAAESGASPVLDVLVLLGDPALTLRLPQE